MGWKHKKCVMKEQEMQRALNRMVHEMIEQSEDLNSICFVGIHTRGIPMALHFANLMRKYEGIDPPVGKLDITLYRDDLTEVAIQPLVRKTEISFDIAGKEIVLCDDVLFTGRTIRAALDALVDLGRPSSIKLAILVDRGHRELPIHPDYMGKGVQTARKENIKVCFHSTDQKESVDIWENDE